MEFPRWRASMVRLTACVAVLSIWLVSRSMRIWLERQTTYCCLRSLAYIQAAGAEAQLTVESAAEPGYPSPTSSAAEVELSAGPSARIAST